MDPRHAALFRGLHDEVGGALTIASDEAGNVQRLLESGEEMGRA